MPAARYETLVVEVSPEGFATVTLNRPEKLNALSIALRRELAAAVAALEADPAVHVLIVTGAGRAFSAGLDLGEWAADEAGEAVEAAAAYTHDAVAAIGQFSGPVIGAINGVALTGGLELALACDLLVAASEAKFADTHVAVGLLPGWGGSVRLVQRLGPARAKELALSGRMLGAGEALAWGLVNRVVPAAQLLDEARAFARELLAHPSAGLRACKKLLDEVAALPEAEALQHERAASRLANRGVGREEMAARLAALRRQGRR